MYVLISLFCNDNKDIIGYRLIDEDTFKIEDIFRKDVLLDLIGMGKIRNLEVKDGKVVPSFGSFDRYPKIMPDHVQCKYLITILKRICKDDNLLGYIASDWNGRVRLAREADILLYGEENGFTNAVVKQRDNIRYISSLKGSFPIYQLNEVSKYNLRYKKWDLKELKMKDTKILDRIYKDIITLLISSNTDYMDGINRKYIQNIRNLIIADEVTEISGLFNIDNRTHNDVLKNIKFSENLEGIESSFKGLRGLDVVDLSNTQLIYIVDSFKNLDNLRDIRFSKKIKSIINSVSNLTNLREIDLSELELRNIEYSFNNLGVDKIKMPTRADKIKNSFEGLPQLKHVDLSNTKVHSLMYSFNGLNKLDNIKLNCDIDYIYSSINNIPNLRELDLRGINLERVSYSFSGLPNLEVLLLDSRIERIGKNNFNGIGIEQLDLSNFNNLRSIDESNFLRCSNLRGVILPEGLEYIGNMCFRDCQKLEYVYIPNSVEHIGRYAFNGTNLRKIELGKGIRRFSVNFMNNTDIVFRDGIDRIKTGVFKDGSEFNSIEIPDSVDIINNEAINRLRVNKVKLSKNLEKIGSKNFNECMIYGGLDLSYCKNLRIIEDNSFNSLICNYVILPEGLEEISEKCFNNGGISYIVLPKSLERIGNRSFLKNIQARLFYVYKDSYALKYCKKKGYPYIEIESLDELQFLNRDTKINDKKIAKYTMLLANHELHKELLKPEYKNNIDKIYDMYSIISKKYKENSSLVELNTSKFIDFPLYKIKLLDDIVKVERRKLEENSFYMSDFSKNNLSTRFKVLCNYITSSIEFTNLPFTTNSLKYLDSIKNNIRHNVIYKDKYSIILGLNVNVPYDGDNSDYSNLIIAIVMGDSIRFVGVIDSDIKYEFRNNMLKDHSYKNILKGTVTSRFKVGDILYKYNWVIGGIKVPNYVGEAIIKSFGEHLLPIRNFKEANIRIYLDIDSGVILELVGDEDLLDEGSDIDFIVKRVLHINNIGEEKLSFIKNKKAIEMYRFITYKDKYTRYMSSLEGAYDNEPCYEWKIMKELRDKGLVELSSVSDLTKGRLMDILETAFFKKLNVSKSYLDKKCLYSDTYILSDYTRLVEYRSDEIRCANVIGGCTKYVYHIEEGVCNKRFRVYTSCYCIENVLKSLNKLIPKETGEELKLRNIRYTKDDVYNNYWVYSEKRGFMTHYVYGVDMRNGGVYILATHDKVDYYIELFRFNTIQDLHYFYDKHRYYLDNMVSSLMGARNEFNKLAKLREYILMGYPNNHFIPLNMDNIWNILSKQPV